MQSRGQPWALAGGGLKRPAPAAGGLAEPWRRGDGGLWAWDGQGRPAGWGGAVGGRAWAAGVAVSRSGGFRLG